MRKHKGFGLLAAIFIVLVFAVLAVGLVSLLASESRMVVAEYRYSRAFYIAEAGKNFAIQHISTYPAWSVDMGMPLTRSFGNGYFTLSTTDETPGALTLYSTGIITLEGIAYTRAVRLNIERESPLGSNAFFSFGNIDIGNNASIEGDVSAIGAVNIGTGCTISGSVEAFVDPPEDPPSLDTTYYDGEIATAATTAEGNELYDDTTLSGTYYVKGDVTFDNGADISITGSAIVVATGNVIVGEEVNFGQNLTVIAGGQVTIDKKVNIGASGLWYSSVGISLVGEVGVGEVVVEKGTVFLTPGDIDFKNNAVFNGLIFAGGKVYFKNNADINGNVVAGSIEIENNAVISLNADLVGYDSIIGLSGSLVEEGAIKVIEWSEVY